MSQQKIEMLERVSRLLGDAFDLMDRLNDVDFDEIPEWGDAYLHLDIALEKIGRVQTDIGKKLEVTQ